LPVRVYFEDTDLAGVVYYANYLKFMERARTEWLRARGFEQDALIRELGIVFAVRSVQVDYLRPARFNELLEVRASVKQWGRASVTFVQAVLRYDEGREEILARGEIKVACLDSTSFRPKTIPDALLGVLQDVA
jgi:acyl-CoA thioester hydrolase